jgi:H+/Cl- antiporter ClcA
MQGTAGNMQTNGTLLSMLLSIYLSGIFSILGKTINEITWTDIARSILLAILGGIIGWLTNKILNYITKRKKKK